MDDRSIARRRMAALRLVGEPFGSAVEVVEGLAGVQAENHSQASWAVACRTPGIIEDEFGGLFDEGAILRTHVLRPTWHFVLPEDLVWLAELTGPRIRRSLARVQTELGLADAEVEAGADLVTDAVAAEGPLTRAELAERLADAGLPTGGREVGIVLMFAEITARICSGPLRDGVHTYAAVQDRVARPRKLARREALAELALRYFRGHGPATERDLAYWSSQTLTDVRAGLSEAAAELASFDHEGRTYWHARDLPDDPPHSPRGHILQTLDEYHNGVQDSRHVLDPDGLVPPGRPANTGMVLVDGQMLGGMRRTVRDTEVTFTIDPYRPLADDERRALESAAERYGRFLGRSPQLVTDA